MNVRLILNDNKKLETFIENFNLSAFIDELNTNTHEMIQFGERGVVKHAIQIVEPVEEEVEVVPTT